MADEEGREVDVVDVVSLLSTDGRNFLIRNNGDKVAIGSLEGKMIAFYFSVSCLPHCQLFNLRLIEVYNELSSQDNGFEIIFVSDDRDEDSFNDYFSKMPWFAIPFSDSWMRRKLEKKFSAMGVPTLVILDVNGKVLNREGVKAVKGYGAEGYPFTVEKISKLREEAENAKKVQTLRSVLVSSYRDYLIANDRSKVSVSNLEGKIVALYFTYNDDSSREFTAELAQIYRKLKEIGESFEVVLVSWDDEESCYDEAIESMPWLAFPFNDKSCDKLFCYFDLNEFVWPNIILIGSDGKTMNIDLIELIDEYGFEAWEAYPFSQEKLHELSKKAKAKLESQTLESLLVSGDLDYVIGKKGLKVPIKELVGKTILLYFSARWHPRCRDYLPKLIEEYHEIKNVDTDFEIIFISSDHDQDSFEKFFLRMPWLALPFGDERKKYLNRIFKFHPRGQSFVGLTMVVIGPTGRTVTKEARELLMIHGTDAYPFTEEKIKELEHPIEEMAKGWPEKIKLDLHDEHELVLTRCFTYDCNGCREMGHSWTYRCVECDFDLHPKCALNRKKENGEAHGEMTEEEYVCDGEVCLFKRRE
ncbi:probable nucleoredoxin 1-2 [Zingiber officinale]|uniref:probable nucleoredoxin 1-2 n=1 Tax=Zingiber officinale TaxID=94328 RepID=UPI001C4D484C|nr:probable nucleoredoxin 1-2 [Zingiber officinale]